MREIKATSIRLPKDLWLFLKRRSSEREMNANQLIIELLTKYKNKCEKRLTDGDIVIS